MGDVLLAQVTAKVRAMAGLFVDVTVYKKAFLQAYNHHRPYVFRRLPNGSVEAVGGWDEDSADGTDSGDGMDEADAGSGSAEGVGRNGTGRNGRERKEAEAGVSDEEDDVGDDGEDDVMAEDGEEEEELQLGDEGEIGDAEGKEDGGTHIAAFLVVKCLETIDVSMGCL